MTDDDLRDALHGAMELLPEGTPPTAAGLRSRVAARRRMRTAGITAAIVVAAGGSVAGVVALTGSSRGSATLTVAPTPSDVSEPSASSTTSSPTAEATEPVASASPSAVPATPASTPPAPPTSQPGPPRCCTAVADPALVVGSWRVTGSDDQADQVVTFGVDHDLSVALRCGSLTGAYLAEEAGLFAADIDGGPGRCYQGGDPEPAWVKRAATFTSSADTVDLRGSAGAVVAHLVRLGSAVTPDSARPQPAVPLPAGYAPATADLLVGRWVPALDKPVTSHPFLQIEADARWTGSDGCNGARGLWQIDGEGRLDAFVHGGSTLIGCQIVNVPHWFDEAVRAGIQGNDVLVLVGPDGKVLGKLIPAAKA